jgi:peptide/nickel transport system substrate-binding protein
MTFPYSLEVPLLNDVKHQMPNAICDLVPIGISRNLIVKRAAPPFDNPDLRQAMALSLDRAAFINIITDGQGDIGGAMQPPPEGLWGMPQDMLKTLPGYDPDVQSNRARARQLMTKLGYGPANRAQIKVSVRDLPFLRDPAVILIDQLKEVYIDGELETIDTTNWLPKLLRKDYIVALNGQGSGSTPTSVSTRCTGAARCASCTAQRHFSTRATARSRHARRCSAGRRCLRRRMRCSPRSARPPARGWAVPPNKSN